MPESFIQQIPIPFWILAVLLYFSMIGALSITQEIAHRIRMARMKSEHVHKDCGHTCEYNQLIECPRCWVEFRAAMSVGDPEFHAIVEQLKEEASRRWGVTFS